MTRVDLDAVQARYERAADNHGDHPLAPTSYRSLVESWEDVPALVAELRSARELVEAVRPFRRPLGVSHGNFTALDEALDAYDEAVG